MHGEGTLKLKNGRTFVGDWVNGTNEKHSLAILQEEKQWAENKAKEKE